MSNQDTSSPFDQLTGFFSYPRFKSLDEAALVADFIIRLDAVQPLSLEVLDAILIGWRSMLVDRGWSDNADLIAILKAKKAAIVERPEETALFHELKKNIAVETDMVSLSLTVASCLCHTGLSFLYLVCEESRIEIVDLVGEDNTVWLETFLARRNLSLDMKFSANFRARLTMATRS